MLALIFFALAAFGFSYIIGFSKISKGIREWLFASSRPITQWFVQLIECPACSGVWIGLVFGFIWPELVPAPLHPAPVFLALFLCATGFILGRLTGWIIP